MLAEYGDEAPHEAGDLESGGGPLVVSPALRPRIRDEFVSAPAPGRREQWLGDYAGSVEDSAHRRGHFHRTVVDPQKQSCIDEPGDRTFGIGVGGGVLRQSESSGGHEGVEDAAFPGGEIIDAGPCRVLVEQFRAACERHGVAMGLYLSPWDRHAPEYADPERYRDRYPRELSGGQQQRVGVARGLAADPPVILMDEPFGAVDPITRTRLQDEMLSIQRQVRKTIICVTHDIDEALKLGDRILILSEGGKIEQYDTPENILAAPANEFVEDFVGAGSALKSLALSRLDDVEIADVPTVRVGDSIVDVQRNATASGARNVVVLDERGRPVDFVTAAKLRGERVENRRREALQTVDHRATLNDALDAMLSSSHGAVVVTGGRGEYRGVASFQQIMTHIQDTHEAAESRRHGADAEATPDSVAVANTSSHTDFHEQAEEGEEQ